MTRTLVTQTKCLCLDSLCHRTSSGRLEYRPPRGGHSGGKMRGVLCVRAVVLAWLPCSLAFTALPYFHRSIKPLRATTEGASSSIFVDEESMLAARGDSALSTEKLIDIAKAFLETSRGVGGDPDLLSEEFKFEGPVVGPFSKSEFVAALSNVDFDAAFPDFNPEFYGFHVDPFEGDRVWYTARGKGTNTGPFPSKTSATPATNKRVVNPPQVCSITIDHSTGLIKRYTIGYVVDRNVGNTGGLGGLYGILYAIGRPLPFPEALPWTPSLPYRAFQTIGGFLGRLTS